jgi:hypothetical protein
MPSIVPPTADTQDGAAPDAWREEPYQFPRGVTDPLCPNGNPIAESADRRHLEHLVFEVGMSAPWDSSLRRLGRAVGKYLAETCEHHWHDYSGYADIPAVWQCLWCNSVVTTDPGTCD